MNTAKKAMQKAPTFTACMLLFVLLVSCADEVDENSFDHSHSKTTDMEKHPFEHEFAQQCIARETVNSVNKESDRKLFAEPCMCIATYLLKDLTAKESDKFLHEKKHAQSLRIKYETAAYNCLQKQKTPTTPKIFKVR